MPDDNTSVVNVNEKISPSRAKDTKISRDIYFCLFNAVFVSSSFKITFFRAFLMEKKWKIKSLGIFLLFLFKYNTYTVLV